MVVIRSEKDTPESTEVVVVGAGPTGLLLAGDLATAGVPVTVLERRTEESNLTRAFAVHARTLEELDARGVADEVIASGHRVEGLRAFGKVQIHLGDLPTRFPYVLITPQYNVERVLAARAVRAGAVIVRGARLESIAQDTEGVDASYSMGGLVRKIRGQYLVGADGHHSTVRQALGLDFPGESVVSSLMLADVLLAKEPSELLTIEANSHGFCFIVPYGDGWYRVIARDPHNPKPDSASVTLDEIAGVAEKVLGTDYEMHDPRWMSRFHSEERQVEDYRVERVFLAGDAAHVHSPAGGMGMNTGLQDAANLGWKLAAKVHGRGDFRLLVSYQDERHPIGEKVLKLSGGLIRGALVRSPVSRAVRNTVARGALGAPRVGDRLRGRLSGIGLRYDAPANTHRKVGTRAVDVMGTDGRRLYEALRHGRFVLVSPPGVEVSAGDRDHVDVLPVAEGEGVLVRPDGYVGWVAGGPEELHDALWRWGA